MMEANEHTTINLHREELDAESKQLLMNTAKWTKFLSISGFTFLGLFIVGVLATAIVVLTADTYAGNTPYLQSYTAGISSWTYVGACLILAFIYFIPLYYLYRFSIRIKQAISENNQVALLDAFRFLNKHYMLIGIFTLFLLVLLAITFISIFVSFTGLNV